MGNFDDRLLNSIMVQIFVEIFFENAE